jgi:hypothetical protein
MTMEQQADSVAISDLVGKEGYVASEVEQNKPGTRSSFGIRQSTGRVGDANCYLCEAKYNPSATYHPYCHECTIGLSSFLNMVNDAYRGGSIERLRVVTQSVARSVNTLVYFKGLGADTQAMRHLLRELSLDPSKAE